MLRCVAVCCGVLWCVAVCCGVLQGFNWKINCEIVMRDRNCSGLKF